jgi:hypothetical protein
MKWEINTKDNQYHCLLLELSHPHQVLLLIPHRKVNQNRKIHIRKEVNLRILVILVEVGKNSKRRSRNGQAL